jgi:hypothetical protein
MDERPNTHIFDPFFDRFEGTLCHIYTHADGDLHKKEKEEEKKNQHPI